MASRFSALGLVMCLLTGVSAEPSYRVVPLPEITEQTDVWVRGRLVSVEFRPLQEGERHRFDHTGNVEIIARMQVTDGVPKLNEPEITIHCATLDEFRTRIVKDRECIMALSRRDDGTFGSYYALGLYGWFQVCPAGGTIQSVPGIGQDVPLELVWQIVSDLGACLQAPDLALSLKERWLAKLQAGGLHDFGAAVMVFDALPDLELEPGTLLDAFERHWAETQQRMAGLAEPCVERGDLEPVVRPAFALLQRIADEGATRRLVDLYVRDLSRRHSVFEHVDVSEPLVRIIAVHGGGARRALLKGLVGQKVKWASADGRAQGSHDLVPAKHDVLRAIAAYPGEDMDALLASMLDAPSDYGIRSVLDLAGLWHGLAERGAPQIRNYLEDLLANPTTFDLGGPREDSREETLLYAREIYEILTRRFPHEERLKALVRLHEQGYAGALDRLLGELNEDDAELIPMLTAIPIKTLQDRHMAISFSDNVARAIPDPAFLPQLREIAKAHPAGQVLAALDACGDGEHAHTLAKTELQRPVPSGDWRTVYDLINNKTGVLYALGYMDDPSLVPLIVPFTQANVLDEYRENLVSAAKAQGNDPHDYPIRGLEWAAILALARCGGAEATSRLHEVYKEGDIAARIAAAMGLYALGDETGIELVRLFAEHRELENPEIKARWRIDLLGRFHAAAKYLQNSRTDAILLERLKGGFSESDHDIIAYREFVAEHEPEVLHALVDALQSSDPTIRSHAHRLLQRLAGLDFDYDPGRPARQQSEAIARCRERVEEHLRAHSE